MQRTIRIRLEPSLVQAEGLKATVAAFTSAFNQTAAMGWEATEGNATKLHYITYHTVKANHPTLVSDFIIQSRMKAAESLRSAFAFRKRGRNVSMPQSAFCPPRYNVHTYKVDWESRTVRMSTAIGRQTIRFHLPDYAGKYAGCPVDTADLLYRHGKWWLHVVVTVPAPEVPRMSDVVGVDLGLVQPAVTSTNRFLGDRRWRDIENKVFKLKRSLQKKRTKSAKRHLKRLKGKQRRFRRDCDHVLSKRIVQATPPGGTVVIENLKDIRKRTKIKRKTQTSRRVHSWSFAQLRSFIQYKAEDRGCTVVAVDPRHTSQACFRCGHTARNNRRSRGLFKCRKCGFTLNADLNAARNVAAKYHAASGIPKGGGLPVNQPIVGKSALHDSLTSPILNVS